MNKFIKKAKDKYQTNFVKEYDLGVFRLNNVVIKYEIINGQVIISCPVLGDANEN